jgi:hypothetical protein
MVAGLHAHGYSLAYSRADSSWVAHHSQLKKRSTKGTLKHCQQHLNFHTIYATLADILALQFKNEQSSDDNMSDT